MGVPLGVCERTLAKAAIRGNRNSVVTEEELVSAITWFGGGRLFPQFGLPAALPGPMIFGSEASLS
jgi:hypothetical protein